MYLESGESQLNLLDLRELQRFWFTSAWKRHVGCAHHIQRGLARGH